MEGITPTMIVASLLMCLALAVLGITSLLAIAFCITRRTKPALLVFASGLFSACVIAGLATLLLFIVAFTDRNKDLNIEEAMFAPAALSLFLAGTGQFVAALRRPRIYPWALGFTTGSLVFLGAVYMGGSDVLESIFGELNQSFARINLTLCGVSFLMAAASLLIAILPLRGASKK